MNAGDDGMGGAAVAIKRKAGRICSSDRQPVAGTSPALQCAGRIDRLKVIDSERGPEIPIPAFLALVTRCEFRVVTPAERIDQSFLYHLRYAVPSVDTNR